MTFGERGAVNADGYNRVARALIVGGWRDWGF